MKSDILTVDVILHLLSWYDLAPEHAMQKCSW